MQHVVRCHYVMEQDTKNTIMNTYKLYEERLRGKGVERGRCIHRGTQNLYYLLLLFQGYAAYSLTHTHTNPNATFLAFILWGLKYF